MLLDYLPMLRDRLTTPMIEDQNEGVGEVIGLMERYDLTKEDYDSVLELTQWPGHKDPRTQIESKVRGQEMRDDEFGASKLEYSTFTFFLMYKSSNSSPLVHLMVCQELNSFGR